MKPHPLSRTRTSPRPSPLRWLLAGAIASLLPVTASADAVDDARALIATFEAGIAEGKGVVTHNGRMIENMHVDNAHRLIGLAEAIAALGS